MLWEKAIQKSERELAIRNHHGREVIIDRDGDAYISLILGEPSRRPAHGREYQGFDDWRPL